MDVGEELSGVRVERPVADGRWLGRTDEGLVALVERSCPDEVLDVTVTGIRKGTVLAAPLRVVSPGPSRVEPPCPHVAEGCGGCDLQHVAVGAQPLAKLDVVHDALRRLGGPRVAEWLGDLRIGSGGAVPADGYRTSVRAVVDDAGRASLRRRGSHETVGIEGCHVAHPLVRELLDGGRFGEAEEVTIRAGAATGERLVLAAPTAFDVEVPTEAVVVGADELTEGRRAWYHDEVGGRRLRISARSFFQSSTAGAELLVDAVRSAGGEELARAGKVLDAYAGVGLFAATVVPDDADVVAVEWNRSSIADAKVNLGGPRRGRVKVVRADVARWRPTTVDIVIADPSRDGLGRAAASTLAATGAAVLVLVSCDAAALGRDARLLAEVGYRPESMTVLDLFPHTHHVEVVTRLVPS